MTEIKNIIEKIVRCQQAPSVQYVLFDKDNIIEKYSCGYMDIVGNKKAGDATTYNAFSITKTFTALAVLQLAEKQQIDIDQSVNKYLPEFPYPAEITVRQLLAHTAGIPNPIPLNWIHPANRHPSFDRNQFFKNVFTKNIKLRYQPGQKFAYSNLGYVLLGQLIEAQTGSSYEHYITDNIIDRLACKKEELGFEIAHPECHAKGYHKNWSITNLLLGFFINKSASMGKTEGGWKPFNNFYVNGISYGGLIGSPAAFVKYVQELLKPDSSLVSADYRKMMFTENYTRQGKATGMGLSWFCGHLNGIPYFTHAGGGGGYYSEIRLYPEKQIGSVIFFNRTGMSDERFLNKLDQFYLVGRKGGN